MRYRSGASALLFLACVDSWEVAMASGEVQQVASVN